MSSLRRPTTNLMDRLHRKGVLVALDGGRLIVRPSENLTDTEKDEIRARKAELMALLQDQSDETDAADVPVHELSDAQVRVLARSGRPYQVVPTPRQPRLTGAPARWLPRPSGVRDPRSVRRGKSAADGQPNTAFSEAVPQEQEHSDGVSKELFADAG